MTTKLSPFFSKRRATGPEVSFHNRIIGNFIVYQDRIGRNLLKICVHPENSDWFSIISFITFDVNIVVEQKQTYL